MICEKGVFAENYMVYESNKNFVCSSCLVKYDVENKRLKQEEVKQIEFSVVSTKKYTAVIRSRDKNL